MSNKTSFEGSRSIKMVFLSYTQLIEQHGQCSYSGVFSLSHSEILECLIILLVYNYNTKKEKKK